MSNSISGEFKITQNIRSEQVLIRIKEFFKCGNIVWDNKKTNCKKYTVKSTKDLINIIIPFFEYNFLITSKQLDFICFKECLKMIDNKDHLTEKDKTR